MKAFCTQNTDRECREEDCCLLELSEMIDKILGASKALNVIINPVERWFHYEKPVTHDMVMQTMTDPSGNPVVCFHGWETWKCDGIVGESGAF